MESIWSNIDEVLTSDIKIFICICLSVPILIHGRRLYLTRRLRRYLPLSLLAALFVYRLGLFRRLTSTQLNLENRTSLLHALVGTINRLSDASSPLVGLLVGDLLGFILVSSLLGIVIWISSFSSFIDFKKKLFEEGFKFARIIPQVQSILNKEKRKAEDDFERDLKTKSRSIGAVNIRLPKTGMCAHDIVSFMKDLTDKENLSWKQGRQSGSVYFDWSGNDQSHLKLLNAAFGFYSIANPLHPDMWPSGMKFEAEIIAMTANLVNGGLESVCGCTTSVSVYPLYTVLLVETNVMGV